MWRGVGGRVAWRCGASAVGDAFAAGAAFSAGLDVADDFFRSNDRSDDATLESLLSLLPVLLLLSLLPVLLMLALLPVLMMLNS